MHRNVLLYNKKINIIFLIFISTLVQIFYTNNRLSAFVVSTYVTKKTHVYKKFFRSNFDSISQSQNQNWIFNNITQLFDKVNSFLFICVQSPNSNIFLLLQSDFFNNNYTHFHEFHAIFRAYDRSRFIQTDSPCVIRVIVEIDIPEVGPSSICGGIRTRPSIHLIIHYSR